MNADEIAARLAEMDAERDRLPERPAVVHIRRRLARSTSTNNYLDHSDRGRGTYCGAPETSYDYAYADRLTRHCRENEATCEACLDAVAR